MNQLEAYLRHYNTCILKDSVSLALVFHNRNKEMIWLLGYFSSSYGLVVLNSVPSAVQPTTLGEQET